MSALLIRKKTIDIASKYAESGFLCSESVLLALSEHLGIKSQLIPKIATGMSAGIARNGMICGALAGGIMGLGLIFGRSSPEVDNEKKPYWFTHQLVMKFRDKLGDTSCLGLLGLDLSKPEEYETYSTKEMWQNNCRDYIMKATEFAIDIIKENSEEDYYSVGA